MIEKTPRVRNALHRLGADVEQMVETADAARRELEARQAFLDQTVQDRFGGVELLAKMWEDYELARARLDGSDLILKSHPAYSAADAVKAKGRELATVRRRAKYLEHVLRLYEWHVPWLSELRDLEAQEGYEALAEPDGGERAASDPVAGYLTREEYNALSETERNQRALDRYRASRKSAWQVGRDYERFVGYQYEQDGWSVEYHGIARGLEDLGRDVIATRDAEIEVVQCKRWSHDKTIHEKHVFQLFGTVTAFRIDNPSSRVRGRFVTTTSLSERAQEFARILDLDIDDNYAFDGEYPCIKCNVSPSTGERIYHLPIDQQYDRTIIHRERGELYAATVAQAEELGFRRAWRWRGEAATT
jgi:Restriction endonuclease